MIQARTQTAEYWGAQFSHTDSDIEQLYNHFLEVEKPQTIEQLTKALFVHRVNEELKSIRKLVKGRLVYQPQNEYQVGDKLVFPVLDFSQGTVVDVREGFNPEEGKFKVITVDIKDKARDFASSYSAVHALNYENGQELFDLIDLDPESLFLQYGAGVADKLYTVLCDHVDFIELSSLWFVKSLMVDINVGHLHLSEAILEMNDGGPMIADDLLAVLDMDPGIDIGVQRFSLNYALLADERFDDVAGEGRVEWFLHRLEPEGVLETPARLRYQPVDYDRTFLSSQLLMLERELDDEWSEFDSYKVSQPAILSLTYPHRWAGTIPLSSRLRPLFSIGTAPRQRVLFLDESAEKEIVGWVVPEGRYIYGFKDWYDENNIPVGGFLQLAPGPEPGVILINYDRRRPQREWVRLATVSDNRIQFELKRRSIGCGYDDLLIVGSDVVAAIDAVWRRAEANQRSLASILAEIFPALAPLTPQNTVHAKTLYSAVNMLRRMPPGPIFGELIGNPAFQTVGDHYWLYDRSRWQESK